MSVIPHAYHRMWASSDYRNHRLVCESVTELGIVERLDGMASNIEAQDSQFRETTPYAHDYYQRLVRLR